MSKEEPVGTIDWTGAKTQAVQYGPGKTIFARQSGLGLGLSIARQTVRAHGGDTHIRNMPGAGCVFAIDMPLAADEVGAAG